MKKHGHTTKHSQSRTYNSYTNMISRCYRPSSANFDNYGGRGIAVCQEWRAGFDSFLRDMGERPDGMTLDRIDSTKDYAKDNCKWALPSEQARNRRTNVFIEHAGQRKILGDWAKDLGVTPAVISYRLRSGWSTEKALTHRPWGRITPKAQDL
jgi:hypothetical protein